MKRYALVVGISSYAQLPQLTKPKVDAEAVAKILETYGEFQEVKRLPSKWLSSDQCEVGQTQLTSRELIEELRYFLLEQAANSEALLYFSGHGIAVFDWVTQQLTEGFLAASDCQVEWDGDRIVGQQNGISLRSLNLLIGQSKVSSLVVILDCCHAGFLLQKELITQTLTTFNASERDYYLIASCRRPESSWESEEYSLFTEALLAAMVQANADSEGQIVCDRVFPVIESQLQGSGQEPIRMGWGRAIRLLRYSTPTAIPPQEVKEECPYQGLRFFTKETKDFFFGRHKLVGNLKQKLEQTAFILVIGSSGSGKSSLVRAGLIPELERDGWQILGPMVPSIAPLSELQQVFKSQFTEPEELDEIYQLIEEEPEGLVQAAANLPPSQRFLLFVDQFEEVFTLCPKGAERQAREKQKKRDRFIQLLTQVAEISTSPMAVVIAVRADFVGECLHYEKLGQLIQQQAVYMLPLTEPDLTKIIEKPAQLQGYTLESGLLPVILDDVQQEAECLPLLEFTLEQLWQPATEQGHQLTVKQYLNLGRVSGALNRHAEKIYEKIGHDVKKYGEQGQEWVKLIFLSLLRTGIDQQDTRQRQLKADLLSLAGDNPASQQLFEKVLEQLVKARLLVSGGREVSQLSQSSFSKGAGEPQKLDKTDSEQPDDSTQAWVDLSHESLIGGWKRLTKWREESRELRNLIDRVRDAEREWEKPHAKADQYLMMGGLLTEVKENWNKLESYFPRAKEFYQRSLNYEKQQFVKNEQPLIEAKLQEQSARVINLLENQPLEALRLAIKTTQENYEKLPQQMLNSVKSSLHKVMETAMVPLLLQGHKKRVTSVAFSPDGQYLVSGSEDGTVRRWNCQGKPIDQPLRGHQGAVTSIAISPDGRYIASGSEDMTIRLWDSQGKQVGKPFLGHQDMGIWTKFRMFLQSCRRFWGKILLWSLGGLVIFFFVWLLISEFGLQLTCGMGWSMYSDELDAGTQECFDSVGGYSFLPTLVLTGIILLGLFIRKVLPAFRCKGPVTSLAFSPDSRYIISGGRDKTLRLWNLRGKLISLPFRGHENSVNSVAFSPDGQHIASGSLDRTVGLWNLQGQLLYQTTQEHQQAVTAVAFSPDGQQLVSGSLDKTVHLWEIKISEKKKLGTWAKLFFLFRFTRQSWVKNIVGIVLSIFILGLIVQIHGWLACGIPFGESVPEDCNEDISLFFLGIWIFVIIPGLSWIFASLSVVEQKTFLSPISEPFLGHETGVTTVTFSLDGKMIASGSLRGKIRLWNRQGIPLRKFFPFRQEAITSISFNPDRQYIASAGPDNTIKLWQLRNKLTGIPLRVHQDAVTAVAFSPKGQYIASSSQDKTLRLWKFQANAALLFQGHEAAITSVAISPDGQQIVSGSRDMTIRLWDIQGNPLGQPFHGHQGAVTAVAFSLDGQFIASGSEDKTIRLWDTQGNSIGKSFPGHQDVGIWQKLRLLVYSCLLNWQKMMPWLIGTLVSFLVIWIMIIVDYSIEVIDSLLATLSCFLTIIAIVVGVAVLFFTKYEGAVTSIAFSPDGKYIVSGGKDNTLRLWNLRGKLMRLPFLGHQSSVTSVAFSPDGQSIASGSHDKTVRLWNRKGKQIFQPSQRHRSSVTAVAFSPNGEAIVSGSHDNTVRLWDIQKRQPERRIFRKVLLQLRRCIQVVRLSFQHWKISAAVLFLSFILWLILFAVLDESVCTSPDDWTACSIHMSWLSLSVCSLIILLMLTQVFAYIIRSETAVISQIGETFEGHKNDVTTVAISSDGQTIISGSRDNTVRLWNLQGNPIAFPLVEHESEVTAVAISSDRRYIVSGSSDCTLRLWDLGEYLMRQPACHQNIVTSIAFSPDGQTLVSGTDGGTIQLWDTQGNAIGQAFSGHEKAVTAVSFSPNGQQIVSGSSDRTIRLWNIQGHPVGEPFEGHQEAVTSVSFSPDGQQIVSGSSDRTIRLWNIQGHPVGEPFEGHQEAVTSVSFSPDGQQIVSGSADHTVCLWHGSWQGWLQVCRERLFELD